MPITPVRAAVIPVDSTMTTATINAAIAGASDGDIIQFADGIYNLDAPLVVDVSGVTLQGDTTTPSNVVINAPTTGSDRDCFQVMCNDVTIQGFKMTNAISQPSGAGNQNGGIMVGNWGTGFWATNPDVADLSGFDFSYNSFDDCSYGIYFFACSDAVISHNTFTNINPSTLGFDGIPIILYNTGYGPPYYTQDQDLIDNVIVSHNTISSCAKGVCIGSENYGGNSATISDITIKDNDVSGATVAGIMFFSYRYDDTVPTPTWTNINVDPNNIHGNKWGLEVCGLKGPDWDKLDGFSLAGIHVNWNNIYDNDLSGIKQGFCVVGDATMGTVDAEYNWWGDASGPGGVGPGTGDAVSDNVNYDPWLTSSVEGAKSETVTGSGTVDATDEADISVNIDATGDHTVTCAEYANNPDSAFSNEVGKYYDVKISTDTDVTSLTLKFYYTDADIAGRDESTLEMLWWDGSSWVVCTDQTLYTTSDISGYSGYIEVTVGTTGSPKLSDLVGTPFGPRGNPTPAKPVGGEVFLVDKLALLMPYIATILAVVATGAVIIKKRRY